MRATTKYDRNSIAAEQRPKKTFAGGDGGGRPRRPIRAGRDDLGARRIREMEEAGIDLQVLSHSIPGL